MSDDQSSAAETGQPQFVIQRIFTKDVSFEAPNSPEMFLTEWQPDVDINLRSDSRKLEDTVYDVSLTVTVTVKVGEQSAFLAEVQQGGVFVIAGFEDGQMGHMLGSYCLNVLFPYVRETVSDLVTRGGFPQLLLAPVNFDALYAQHVAEQKQGPLSSGE